MYVVNQPTIFFSIHGGENLRYLNRPRQRVSIIIIHVPLFTIIPIKASLSSVWFV